MFKEKGACIINKLYLDREQTHLCLKTEYWKNRKP